MESYGRMVPLAGTLALPQSNSGRVRVPSSPFPQSKPAGGWIRSRGRSRSLGNS